MSNEKNRALKIAEDTLEIVKAGKYKTNKGKTLSVESLVDRSVKRSKLYKPDWTPLVAGCHYNNKPTVTVTNESTIEAAMRLKDNNACALNFASAKHPGGGFLRGCLAQEESIARSSALYHTLIVHPEFYEENKRSQKENIGLYLNYAIYSPDVPIFKMDNGELLEEPFTVSILTSPAPNRNAIVSDIEINDEIEGTIDILINNVFDKRIRQVLNIMADNGHRTIILGAWGCGAFGNDPGVVANLFANCLEETPYFDNIIFAIYDDPNSITYKTFDERFGK